MSIFDLEDLPASFTDNLSGAMWDTDAMNVMIPMLRRVMPSLLADEIAGVQPMTDLSDTFRWITSTGEPERKMTELEAYLNRLGMDE